MSNKRKVINSIIEPQLSSDVGGIQWYRTLTPADAAVSKPFFGLEIFQSGESEIQPPNPKPRDLRKVTFFQYLLKGKYSMRVDNEMVMQMNSGDFLAFNAGPHSILEEAFLPSGRKLEGFRLWKQSEEEPPKIKSIILNPNHKKGFFNDRTIQIQEFMGSYQFTGSLDQSKEAKINILNVSLLSNSEFRWSPPQDHNVIILVYEGRGVFGLYEDEDVLLQRCRLLLYGEGEEIFVRSKDIPLRFLVATGMNT